MSIALVKNRALLAPNGASSAAIGARGEVAGQHDPIVDRDAVVVDRDVQRRSTGVIAAPAVRCRECSGLSGTAPRTCAAGELTGSVSDSTGTSPCPRFRKLVAVDEKNDCPSDGARKPVLTEPRTMKRGSICTRAVTLPSTVLPKSL